MNEFFVLNNTSDFMVSDEFSGYVIFYRKSKVVDVAMIQENLFQKLIQNGLKLAMQNFLLEDVNEHKTRLSILQKKMEVTKCLLFDVKEIEVGINFDIPLYKLITLSGIEFLKADAPEVLEQNKNLKNKLWTQLQLSFKVNQ